MAHFITIITICLLGNIIIEYRSRATLWLSFWQQHKTHSNLYYWHSPAGLLIGERMCSCFCTCSQCNRTRLTVNVTCYTTRNIKWLDIESEIKIWAFENVNLSDHITGCCTLLLAPSSVDSGKIRNVGLNEVFAKCNWNWPDIVSKVIERHLTHTWSWN